MKVVLDTNVLIAAYIAQGHCADVFEQVIAEHTLVTSEFILKELDHNLQKKFRYTLQEVQVISSFLTTHSLVLQNVPPLTKRVSRDRSDDHILAAAYEAKCDLLVTGDLDLRVLKFFRGIPIIPPREFWKFSGKK